jgi:hypothetical protein
MFVQFVIGQWESIGDELTDRLEQADLCPPKELPRCVMELDWTTGRVDNQVLLRDG